MLFVRHRFEATVQESFAHSAVIHAGVGDPHRARHDGEACGIDRGSHRRAVDLHRNGVGGFDGRHLPGFIVYRRMVGDSTAPRRHQEPARLGDTGRPDDSVQSVLTGPRVRHQLERPAAVAAATDGHQPCAAPEQPGAVDADGHLDRVDDDRPSDPR